MIIRVDPRAYDVGDDSIPIASPRHRRILVQSFWIARDLVSWADFERFVAGAGYSREELWVDRDGVAFPISRPPSVDRRVRQLLDESESIRSSFPPGGTRTRRQPVTGLNWYEASAVARFYRARLPYEVEWEIALTSFPPSRRDNVLIDSWKVLQEWTSDAFSPKYWRTDHSSIGVGWTAGNASQLVSVRGCSATDLIRHVAFRRGASPSCGEAVRGFRLVWDQPPPASAGDESEGILKGLGS